MINKLKACKAAIHKVRGEHLRASHELLVRALQELERRLAHGEAFDSKIALDERVELRVVEAIDETIVKVPTSSTNVVRVLE